MAAAVYPAPAVRPVLSEGVGGGMDDMQKVPSWGDSLGAGPDSGEINKCQAAIAIAIMEKIKHVGGHTENLGYRYCIWQENPTVICEQLIQL